MGVGQINSTIMRKICIHFQINQPYLLRTYRFFDINQRSDYFDDYQNRYLTNRLSERCYRPANALLLDLIERFNDQVAFSFCLSESAISQFKEYAPDVLEGLQKLVKTGRVEITGTTFTHSLACLNSRASFEEQVRMQEKLIMETFGVKPVTFFNTEAIYSDEIGEWLYDMGYRVVLTEGARHILGWKSPTYLYCNPYQVDEKLMLRSASLCDDITFRFEDRSWCHFPLTAEKYLSFLKDIPESSPYINLYFDYDVLGDIHTKESGIFDFFSALCQQVAESSEFQFVKPEDLLHEDTQTSTLLIPWPISNSGDEKDTSEWIGNELQQEAFQQLFKIEPLYQQSENEMAKLAWVRLQDAIHFNFMGTQWFPQSSVKMRFDIYSSPYQAFINYMNVLSDVKIQLEKF